MSDMAGGKASALFGWAVGARRECLLLDYSGCGESPGEFADGTLSRWRDEVVALAGAVATGPLVLGFCSWLSSPPVTLSTASLGPCSSFVARSKAEFTRRVGRRAASLVMTGPAQGPWARSVPDA
jgi:hypothetical protein